MSDFLSTVLASGIGFFVARLFGGWLDARVQYWTREEGQRDADLSEIKQVAREIREIATEYWSRSYCEDDRQDEGALIGRLSYLSDVTAELFELIPDLRNAVELELNRLDTAVTGGDFQTIKRVPNGQNVAYINTASFALTHKAELLRRKLPKTLRLK